MFDAIDDSTCRWLARYYGIFIQGTLAYIKSKFCLPYAGIWAVTGKAMCRQQWANIPVEVDALIRFTNWCQTKEHHNYLYNSQGQKKISRQAKIG